MAEFLSSWYPTSFTLSDGTIISLEKNNNDNTYVVSKQSNNVEEASLQIREGCSVPERILEVMFHHYLSYNKQSFSSINDATNYYLNAIKDLNMAFGKVLFERGRKPLL